MLKKLHLYIFTLHCTMFWKLLQLVYWQLLYIEIVVHYLAQNNLFKGQHNNCLLLLNQEFKWFWNNFVQDKIVEYFCCGKYYFNTWEISRIGGELSNTILNSNFWDCLLNNIVKRMRNPFDEQLGINSSPLSVTERLVLKSSLCK